MDERAGSPPWPLLALVLALALIPLFTTPLLPFIDLYNHISRFFVLAHVDDSALLAANYQSNWGLLPNIGLDAVGTLALRAMAPEYAAHAMVIAIFVIQYTGMLAFNRALTGRTSLLVAVLGVPLLYSYILNWGFANFLFGLGMVFWAAAWWLHMRHRLVVAVPVACLLAVLIFFTHGLAFAIYGALVGALEIGLWLERRPRRAGTLALALVPVAVQALVPALLFLAASTSKTPTGLTNADESVARLHATGALIDRLWELFQHRLVTIVRVAEGPSLAFDAVALVLSLAVIAWLLWRGGARIARVAWPALAIAALLVVLVPPAMFGVGYVADRMPLYFALLLVGALSVPEPRARSVALATGALAGLAAVRLAAIALGWQAYARDYREFEAVAALIPPGSLINDLAVGGSPRDTGTPRCAMYRPLLIAEHGQVGPMFADEAKQPVRLSGPLRAALARLPTGFWGGNMPMSFYDDWLAATGPAGFQYVLVCNAERLTRPLPRGTKVLHSGARFTLMRMQP